MHPWLLMLASRWQIQPFGKVQWTCTPVPLCKFCLQQCPISMLAVGTIASSNAPLWLSVPYGVEVMLQNLCGLCLGVLAWPYFTLNWHPTQGAARRDQDHTADVRVPTPRLTWFWGYSFEREQEEISTQVDKHRIRSPCGDSGLPTAAASLGAV